MVQYLQNNLTKSKQATSTLTEKQRGNVRKRVLQSKKQDVASTGHSSTLDGGDPQSQEIRVKDIAAYIQKELKSGW